MKSTTLAIQLLILGALSFWQISVRADANAALDFNEVREIIRAHLPDVTDAELDRGALDGLLHSMRGKVTVVSLDSSNTLSVPAISRAWSPAEGIGYLRLAGVREGVVAEINTSFSALNSTNKIAGLILDLRFIGGDDYAAAVQVADLFIADEKPLLDCGAGMMKSSAKTNALSIPVTLLVNGETVGASEALAEIMRNAGVGLILGNTTRGAAMTSREFTLKNGSKLRIADSPVKTGNGSVMSDKGVTPDIVVAVSQTDERAYMADAYATPSKTGMTSNDSVTSTNVASATKRAPRRVRLTEADLVRARREGVRLDEDLMPQSENEPEKNIIRDPALARAVDLLKGLAVVRRTRS